MIYKNLVRALRKYNEDNLLTRVSDLHKKATASGAGFYMPSEEVMRYISGAYLKRLFRLQQIRDLCIRTAHVIMGQLELGHWEKFSLFIVALCADVSNGIRMQASSMEPAYDGLSKSLHPLDNRFPETLAELSIFPSLRGRISAQKNTDMSRVMRLLQLSDEQLDAVRTRDQMAQFRAEILSNVESKDEDLGEAIDRTEQISVVQTPTFDAIRKPSSADSGLELGSENSILNTATDHKEQVNEEEDVEQGRQKLAKKRKRKRKNEVNYADTSSLSPISIMSPLASSTVVAKAKKKRKRRLLEDTFYHDLDSAENCSVLNRTCLTEGTSPVSSSVLSYKTTKKKKKKVSQKTSILSSDNGDRHSSPEQFSSAENCQLSVGSAIDQSIGSVKKKRKLNLEKLTIFETSSMDLSYQSAAGISWQRLSTDESCFKTPKKLKRKIGEETDDSFVKRRPHDDADAGSDGKVRKKKKKKKPLCDIPV